MITNKRKWPLGWKGQETLSGTPEGRAWVRISWDLPWNSPNTDPPALPLDIESPSALRDVTRAKVQCVHVWTHNVSKKL